MINPKERTWLAVATLLILVYSSLPNWVGYVAETKKLSYRGAFFDPQDYAVHISMLRAGMQGDWAYQFRFTTEPHTAAYTRVFYVTLGQVNRLLHLPPTVLFEIARWFFGALSLFALYILSAHIFEEVWWRRIAFLLAVFASGLGWAQLIIGWMPKLITPIDFWLIDAYFFFGLALFPHFSFVTALLCLAFAFYLDFLETNDRTRIFWIGLFSILVQFVNPIAFVLVDVVFAAATLIHWIREQKVWRSQILALGLLAITQIPLLIYNLRLLTFDPVWSQFTRQNETLSPPLVYYFYGFGLLWLFALLGAVSAFRWYKTALIASATWIVAGLLLAYAPFAIQRRFLHAITIPLAFLGTQGLISLSDLLIRKTNFRLNRIRIFVLLTVFLLSISSLALGLGRSMYLLGHPDEYYYDVSLDKAFNWLQENASPNDFVLSTTSSGQLIAQETDMRVYLGHEMETLNYLSKVELVDTFYQGQAEQDWLMSTDTTWVLYGPYEQRISQSNKIASQELEPVYQFEKIIIYQVLK